MSEHLRALDAGLAKMDRREFDALLVHERGLEAEAERRGLLRAVALVEEMADDIGEWSQRDPWQVLHELAARLRAEAGG